MRDRDPDERYDAWLNGDMPRPVTVPDRFAKYDLCCEEAVEVHDCTCARKTQCPEHGERHRGTHD